MQYIHHGDSVDIQSSETFQSKPTIDPGVYTVEFALMRGFYLKQASDFKLPEGKIYGDVYSRSNRIINTFKDRTNSTGVLLIGQKGSGKTMLTKIISDRLAKEENIATVIVNSSYDDSLSELIKFIQSIDISVCILFDEFEKVFDKEEQEQLLTLFDGVFTNKKLFLLTANSEYKIDEHMFNRPGRIHYKIDYHSLEEDFVREYAEDNLKDKSQVEPLVNLAKSAFSEFNFDMLKAIVEEMNRHNESPKEAIRFLNVVPTFGGSSGFNVTLEINGKPVPEKNYNKFMSENPLENRQGQVYFYLQKEFEKQECVCIKREHLSSYDTASDTFFFEGPNYKAELTRIRSGSKFNFFDAF